MLLLLGICIVRGYNMSETTSRKCIYMTLGFDTSAFMTSLTKVHANNGDKYVFIVPKTESEKGIATKNSIKSIIHMLRSRGLSIQLEFLSITENDAYQGVLDLLRHIADNDFEKIIFCVVGGLRSIITISLLAIAYAKRKITKVFTIAENTGSWIDVPIIIEPELPNYKDALALFKNGKELKIENVANLLKRDMSNASRALTTLERQGFLKKIKDYKPYVYASTKKAEIYWLYEKLNAV